MLITTSHGPSLDLANEARLLAQKIGGRYVPREGKSLDRLREKHGERSIMVLSETGLKYFHGENPPLFFHPSMAFIRIKRLMQGNADPLVELAEAKPGDTVLDCTAGFASDSIVFSFAVGPQGKVTALESEKVIAVLLADGLKRYQSGDTEIDAAMRRIEVVCAEHTRYLKDMKDKSADIVYFDPMFRTPVEDSAAIAPLRNVANPSSLNPEAIRQACRVARKKVIMKEHRDSGEFARLGFEQVRRTQSKIAYGVIDCARDNTT